MAFGAHLPLAERIRADLARFAPRGTLARGRGRWEGPADSPKAFAASAEFRQLGVTAQDAFPGATGITGRFDVNQDGGEIRVASHDAALDLPRVFRAPISFDNLRSVVKWERRDRTTTVRIEQFEFANADLAGSASGTWRANAQGPGEIDLVAQLSRALPGEIHRYLPTAVNDATRDWLRTAIAQGAVADARLKLAGNLAEFPFAGGKRGQFVATAKARAVTLAYAPDWPPIEGIDAEIRLEGTRLRVDGARGLLFGVNLGKTRAEIQDVTAAVPLLTVDGEAEGPAAGFLRFVNESPVGALTGKLTRDMEASGNGRLALKLGVHLGGPEETTAVGEFALAEGQLRVPGVPTLAKVNGKLAFSEREVHGGDVAMEVLGGPTKLAITGAGDRLRVSAGGAVNLAVLRREYATAYLDRLSGTVDWTIAIDARPEASSWVLESTMKGALVDLPAPLGKVAADAMPLRIERRDDVTQAGTDFVMASYGRVAQLAAHRRSGASGPIVDRALLSLGRAIERPDGARAERPGLWVRAELPALSVDDWLAATRRRTATDGERPGEGRRVRRGRSRRRTARSAGPAVQRPAGEDARGADRVAARPRRPRDCRQRDLVDAGSRGAERTARRTPRPAGYSGRAGLAPWTGADSGEGPPERKADPAAASLWPAIDVTAEALVSKGRDLGQLELVAQASGADWRIDRLALVNDAGRIDAEGVARGEPAAADEARRGCRREGCRRIPCAIRLRRGGAATHRRRSPATSSGPAPRTSSTFPTLDGTFSMTSGRAASPRSSPASASCSACCRCRRCRGESRSISATSSARASPSTRSPATFVSRTA